MKKLGEHIMPQIEIIQWSDVEYWLRKVASSIDEVDTIVGVARSGAAIATALSYLWPDKNLVFATRAQPRGAKEDFYVFDDKRHQRLQQNRMAISLSKIPSDSRKILVVDDVATFGDTLACIQEKIIAHRSDALVSFACYAVDTTRLHSSRPEILAATTFCKNIDNQNLWLKFPWQLT
jgi:hypoxanthine phosphoribosyltransferase